MACGARFGRAGGPADGRLEVGDVVTSVNGTSTEGLELASVTAMITASTETEFGVARGAFHLEDAEEVAPPTGFAPITPTTAAEQGPGTDTMKLPEASPAQDQMTITLVRDDSSQSYGFGFGITEDGLKVVTKVAPSGVAEGKLQGGDVVLAVNGTATTELAHAAVVQLIKSTNRLELLVHREPVAENEPMSPRDFSIVNTVTLTRASLSDSLGFNLGSNSSNDVCVSLVHEGGLAHGRLVAGDVLMEVNGMEATAVNYQAVLQEIKASLAPRLVIRRFSERQ